MRVTLGAGRTAIDPPLRCNSISIKNTDGAIACKLWDESAGGDWIRLGPGVERTFTPATPRHVSINNIHQSIHRFVPGVPEIWVEPDSGAPVIELIFIL